MLAWFGVYFFGVVCGVGLMALFCANGRDDNDFYGGIE